MVSSYVPKFVGYLKAFRKSKPKTKDLLGMLKEWKGDFDKEALYGNHVDYNNAKHKYMLMRWDEYEVGKAEKSKLVMGSYEDEKLGIWYCGGEEVRR